MKLDWNIGDWCFSEFELKQIKDIRKFKDGNAITEVTDGYFSHSGIFLNDICYPMDITIKLISENFKHYSDKLHQVQDLELKKGFPNIHRKLVRRWCKCCDDKDDIEKIQEHYSKLEEWYILSVDGIKELRKLKLKKIDTINYNR